MDGQKINLDQCGGFFDNISEVVSAAVILADKGKQSGVRNKCPNLFDVFDKKYLSIYFSGPL